MHNIGCSKNNVPTFHIRMSMNEKSIYNREYTGDDTIPAFVTFCIEQYKNHKGISGAEAMQVLADAGVIEYLAEHYDALHLESGKWILNDIDRLVESKALLK